MHKNTLWSLRLGYSAKQEKSIQKIGLKKFLKQSFATKFDSTLPDFLQDSPKNFAEYRENRDKRKSSPEGTKEFFKKDGLEDNFGGESFKYHYNLSMPKGKLAYLFMFSSELVHDEILINDVKDRSLYTAYFNQKQI